MDTAKGCTPKTRGESEASRRIDFPGHARGQPVPRAQAGLSMHIGCAAPGLTASGCTHAWGPWNRTRWRTVLSTSRWASKRRWSCANLPGGRGLADRGGWSTWSSVSRRAAPPGHCPTGRSSGCRRCKANPKPCACPCMLDPGSPWASTAHWTPW
eukprot:scaffold2968_cov802-Pavlova_lutheri.AAC.2